ncbi:MAG: putative sulfate exporter family transporter, partial [Sphingomicrobium sp.]
VYAVPQVLAATLPVGALAAQVGTLVKLVRVLMLGPVVLALSLLAPKLREETDEPAPAVTAGDRPSAGRPPLHKLVPWFIIGFILLAGARSLGMIPQALLQPLSTIATWLTILAMAALGLGVDMRAVARAGPRVTLVVTLSLLVLAAMALALIHALNFR